MNRIALYFGFAIVVLWCAVAVAETPNEQADSDTVTIPLDQIWAYKMPGTRDVAELEPDNHPQSEHGALVAQIRSSLSQTPPTGKSARTGFAVFGTGLEALRDAHAVLVKNEKPRQSFPADSEISVVFFSYQFGPYAHLRSIERRGNVVEICYRFVPHRTEEVTEHFALIPLGKLASGKYDVKVVPSSMEQQSLDLGFRPVRDTDADRIVCHSFSFSVAEQGE